MKKLNILGTIYYVVENNDRADKEDFDGLCDFYNKKIILRSVDSMLEIEGYEEAKKARYEEVLRHEIVHAFFYESGLTEEAYNEKLVDWLAVQLPKIIDVIKGGDVL